MSTALARPPFVLPLCLHCRRRRQHKPDRGLCRVCTSDHDIRVHYPTEAEKRGSIFARGLCKPVCHDNMPLPEPTEATPGSPEKIEILAYRYANHQQLWHPLDAEAELDDPEPTVEDDYDDER